MLVRIATILCIVFGSVPSLRAADADAPPAIGWRGNLTGLFPDSKAPLTWSLVSTGPAEGMSCAATLPADVADSNSTPVDGGLVTKWLAIGPFAVKDGTADFATELIPGEANITPKAGDKVGDLEWKPAEPASDGVSFMSVNAIGAKARERSTRALWRRRVFS